jgi:coiled-coil domain-containing protein 55
MASFKIGIPTKKYGLIQNSELTGKPLPVATGKSRTLVKIHPDDEEEVSVNVEEELKRQREKRERMMKAENDKLVATDPNVFAYDEFVEEDKTKIIKTNDKIVKEKPKPKYIHSIMERAKEHKREGDIIYNKMQIKEMEKEKIDYGETEKFITSSYKKKLMEDKLWEEEQAKKDEAEDPTKKEDMRGFLSNLLNDFSRGRGPEANSDPPKKRDIVKKEVDKKSTPAVTNPRTNAISPKQTTTAPAPQIKRPASPEKGSIVEPEQKKTKSDIPQEEQNTLTFEATNSEVKPNETVAPPKQLSAAERAAEARARYLARKNQSSTQ